MSVLLQVLSSGGLLVHPFGLTLSADGTTLFVSNAANGELVEISTTPPQAPRASSPLGPRLDFDMLDSLSQRS